MSWLLIRAREDLEVPRSLKPELLSGVQEELPNQFGIQCLAGLLLGPKEVANTFYLMKLRTLGRCAILYAQNGGEPGPPINKELLTDVRNVSK